MKRGLVAGMLIGMLLSAGVAWAQTPVPRVGDYQVSFWWLARSNSLEVYYYQDDIMRCTVFMATSNGISPICFDRRQMP